MRLSCFLRYAVLAVLPGCGLSPADAQPERDPRGALRSPVGLTLLSNESVRLQLENVQQRPDELRVLDLDGHDLSARLQPRAEGAAAVSVAVTSAAPFIVKPRTIPTVSPTAQKTVLPGGMITPVLTAPNTEAPLRPAWFRVTVASSPVPAVWDAGASRYAMKLTFGVTLAGAAESSATSSSLKLPRPVILKFAYKGVVAEELEPLVIEEQGLLHEKTVDLHFVPNTETPRLLIRSSITDSDLELKALPRLEVRPVKVAAPGLGLAEVEVVIEHVQPHGARIVAERALPVVLQVDGGGSPEPRQPLIEAGASTTTFKLRTSGLGRTTLRASADGVVGVATVEQRFPLGPVIAVLFGGAIGGAGRRFVKGARRAGTGRRVVEGVLVAVVAFVAGILGVGYLGLPPALVATEAGAFLTGALSGFAGVTVLEMLTKKARG